MVFKVYRSILPLEKDWEALCRAGSDMTPYQSFAWNRNMVACYRSNIYTFTRFSLRFLVGYEDGKARVIAPLAIPKQKYRNSIHVQLLGEYSKSGALNVIYDDDVTNDDFAALTDEIIRLWGACDIRFLELSDRSKFEHFLAASSRFVKRGDRICVGSEIPESAEDCYSLLSKSVRQTLRTSYNRLERDHASISIEIHDRGYAFSEEERAVLSELYNKRLREWNEPTLQSGGSSPLRKLLHLAFPAKDSFYSFSQDPHFTYVKCIINGKIAAYFFALHDDNGYYIVPTLIHDTDFDQYSPGLLMINRFLKQKTEQNGIQRFDLSRGNEPYKTRFTPLPYAYRNNDYGVIRAEH